MEISLSLFRAADERREHVRRYGVADAVNHALASTEGARPYEFDYPERIESDLDGANGASRVVESDVPLADATRCGTDGRGAGRSRDLLRGGTEDYT